MDVAGPLRPVNDACTLTDSTRNVCLEDSVKKLLNLQLVESAPLQYLISLPSGPGFDGGKAPVLCYLHGYGEAAPVEIHDALTLHGPLRPDGFSGAIERFIVVAPQLPSAGDIWYRYANAVRQIVNDVQIARGGDPLRTYLTGFSFGGNGVFDLALIEPFFWAALWAVDPTEVPREDPLRPVWLSFGEASRYRKAGFIRSLSLRPAEADPEGDRLYLDQGQDHEGSARLAYRDERIYSWLLSKQLVPGGRA